MIHVCTLSELHKRRLQFCVSVVNLRNNKYNANTHCLQVTTEGSEDSQQVPPN